MIQALSIQNAIPPAQRISKRNVSNLPNTPVHFGKSNSPFQVAIAMSALFWSCAAVSLGLGYNIYKNKKSLASQVATKLTESYENKKLAAQQNPFVINQVENGQINTQKFQNDKRKLMNLFVNQFELIQQEAQKFTNNKQVLHFIQNTCPLTPEEMQATEKVLQANAYDFKALEKPEKLFNEWFDAVIAKHTDNETAKAFKATTAKMIYECKSSQSYEDTLRTLLVIYLSLTMVTPSLSMLFNGSPKGSLTPIKTFPAYLLKQMKQSMQPG